MITLEDDILSREIRTINFIARRLMT